MLIEIAKYLQQVGRGTLGWTIETTDDDRSPERPDLCVRIGSTGGDQSRYS